MQNRPIGRIQLEWRCGLENGALSPTPAVARPTLAPRDRTEPRRRLPRPGPRQQALVGEQKRLLGGVLSLLLVVQQLRAQPLHERPLSLYEIDEQRVELGLFGRPRGLPGTIGVDGHLQPVSPSQRSKPTPSSE